MFFQGLDNYLKVANQPYFILSKNEGGDASTEIEDIHFNKLHDPE